MCSKMLYDPENLNLENFGVVSFTFVAVFFFFLQNSIMNVHNSCFLLTVSFSLLKCSQSNVCANICVFLFYKTLTYTYWYRM